MRALVLQGAGTDSIVVIDRELAAVTAATDAGYTALQGAVTDETVLREALVDRARAVVIALGRDDTAILATLTVRRLFPDVTVIAASREDHNAELLRQSGARSVIVSSETAGRLLGLATASPRTVDVVEDLLSFGHGIDLDERPVTPAEIGHPPAELPVPVLAVVRDGSTLRYSDPAIGPLRSGDQVIYAATP